MKKIKNWDNFNRKPFELTDEKIKKGDYFIFNDDGRIRKCRSNDIKRINLTLLEDCCKKVVFNDNIIMVFDELKLPIPKTTHPNVNINDGIYFLYDYTLEKGVVKSIGKKNIKILHHSLGELYISFDKVSEKDEKICVVWETWRGGRGGYRIERELYSEHRYPSSEYPFQFYVYEYKYGFSCN